MSGGQPKASMKRIHEGDQQMAPTAKSNPIPERYRRVTPALVVNGGVKALEFYAEVFDATERMRFPGPDGTVAHAEIEIGDSVVIIEEASPYMGTKAPPPDGLDGTPACMSRTSTQ
jgi:PhnB protein